MDKGTHDSARHYRLVAEAITYIRSHAHQQPSLADVAQQAGMSEYHFQRLFSEWAGVSPKRFLQYLTKEYAKQALQQSADLLEASYAAGLSAPSRLYDLIVSCEAVTPGEYKSCGAGLGIGYGYAETPFGMAAIGWTARGICYFEFCEEINGPLPAALQAAWGNANLQLDERQAQDWSAKIFPFTPERGRLHLVLRGTNFQLKVWEALLRIKPGRMVSYSQLAVLAGAPNAQRAVGSALAANLVAYLIPCHRVIRESGDINHYRWGSSRKAAMLAWEAVQADRIKRLEDAP
jgi:AraC family transcriptional regulator of adaptative response/methylated-DNA-[protein]-cysteine methyltransferase